MKKMTRFCIFLMILSLFACQKDLPEPESKSKDLFKGKVIVASARTVPNKDAFIVKHFIKGDSIYVECMIKNFSFRKSENKKVQTGKMHVYIDGKKELEISSAAFVIRDLKKGNHHITLELINHNGQRTALKKELFISVP